MCLEAIAYFKGEITGSIIFHQCSLNSSHNFSQKSFNDFSTDTSNQSDRRYAPDLSGGDQPSVSVIFSLFSNSLKNKKLACHIHEFGDTSNGCESLGPHWNPHNTYHGYTFDTSRPCHAGDLIGNLQFDKNGRFDFFYKDPKLSLSNPLLSILGRSVVIHDGIDDLGLGDNKTSLITGNAGGRIACSVIGWKKCL